MRRMRIERPRVRRGATDHGARGRLCTALGLALGLGLLAAALACSSGNEGAGGGGDTSAAETNEATTEPTHPYEWPTGKHPVALLDIGGMGTIEISLYPELAPKTVANFIKLAEEGFYDGTTFHRVIPEFMIQGGDPLSKDKNPVNDGQGGPGYTIDDELNGAPHVPGVLSMAKTARPNTGGSQFFLILGDAPQLDDKHTIFGRIEDDLTVLDAIAAVETDVHGRWGPKNRPIENIVVEHITIKRPEAVTAGD